MEVIDISPKFILVEITKKLGLPDPVYGVEINEGQYVRPYIEVTINKGGLPYEIVRSMGPFGVEQLRLEEQTAIYALNNLKHHFHLEVRDVNFDDKENYKHAFRRVRAKYNDVIPELQQLIGIMTD